MSRFSFIMLFFALFIVASVKGQGSTPNISDFSKIIEALPPSPNAASLGKYGGLDLSLASGTTSINIPIYNYTSINLSVPLSLSYFSNGFRVDEIPGRVGTGWSLNAGGVITRTVFGAVDEVSERLNPPVDFPARSADLLTFMEGLASSEVYGPHDAQPDLFSFNLNGQAGKFILDNNLNPLLLEHSNLKIERDFSSTEWTFKITSADGIQYFFGGDLATEATKKSQVGSGCGKNYGAFIPTAWYLKKIVHPLNDEITFSYSSIGLSYTTGISESIYARNNLQTPASCAGWVVNAPVLQNTSCETWLQTSGVLLEEINSASGNKIKFFYVDRDDCNDKLLSRIELFQPANSTAIRKFGLTYQYSIATSFLNTYSSNTGVKYRPFLSSFSEQSSDALLSKSHSFLYNDINGLPPRLSFAQDHYGYFNGKSNNTLIPSPSTETWELKLPSATANREVDPTFAQKGLLTKIIYPTGGSDQIFYEGNQVYKNVTIYPSQSSVNASATNTNVGGIGTTSYSSIITTNFQQECRIVGSCVSNSTTGGDPVRDKAFISVINAQDNSEIYSITLYPGGNFDDVISPLPAGSHKIKVTSYGDNVTGGATLFYMAGNISYQNMNVNTGGVRVAKTITANSATGNSSVKRYSYCNLLTPTISSGKALRNPLYEKYLKVYVPCMSGTSSDPQNPAGIVNCDVSEFDYYSMYSNTLNNIYLYSSSPISYGSVIESFGENYENGGVERQYTVYEDIGASSIVGNGVLLGSPLTSYSWKNAREIYQQVFKMQGLNYIPVKKIFTSYKEDSRIDQDIKAYVVNKKYTPYCQSSPPSDIEIDAYDLLSFSYFRKWVYVDTVKTWTYDPNGQNYIENLNISEYNNTSHALATKQTTFSSNKVSQSVVTSYPEDIILTGDEETARQELISKHVISPVLQQAINKGINQLVILKTGYNVFPNGLVLPQTHSVQRTGYTIEERLRIHGYDNYGKILQQSRDKDVVQSYQWSYNNTYPITEVVNAPVKDIFHTSFEDAEGNSSVGDSKTGKKSRTGGYTKSLSNLTNGSYILSYWQKSGSTWSLQTSTVVVSTNIYSINLTGQVDEVRFHPAAALMTTYTYDPLIGMTSQTDANNRTTYYEYDGLGRLKLQKDQNGNIIKTMDYKYKTN